MARRAVGGAGADRDEHGQSAVELAIALPLLALFLLGAVQVAVVIRDQLAVIHAARDAARAAAVSTDPGDGASAGRAEVPLPGLEISVASTATHVRADATRRVPTDVPLIGVFLPDITVRATAVMPREP